MPYITMEERAALLDTDLVLPIPHTPGELTYLLSLVCTSYAKKKGSRYQQWCEILGSLEATKLELQRRYIGPYEQKKLETNGDV